MSSTSESLKKAAEEAAVNEPSSKKAKLTSGDSAANEPDNGSIATSDNNNVGANMQTKGVPSKNSNGNDKVAKEMCEINSAAKGTEHVIDDDDDEDAANFEPELDPKIAKHLEQVETIQLEICNLNEKASEEILKVEQKFNKLRRPHFEKRNELLREIPNFWVSALANHPTIAPMVEGVEDEDCLKYLNNLDVEEFEDVKSGYKLKLHFDENPYITNDVIVKEFQILSSEVVVSSSTPIQYKNTDHGNALKQVVENSVQPNRRPRRPDSGPISFFAWLTQPSDAGGDEVAEILKDQIFLNPLEFYFAANQEIYDGDEESDDEDEEIDDEEIDDDEEGAVPEGVEFSDEDIDDEGDDEEDEDEGEGEGEGDDFGDDV